MSSYITKVSSQGQVSVPVEVRKRLEVEPGSVLEWTLEGDRAVVQRRKVYTTADIQAYLRSSGPVEHLTDEQIEERSVAALKEKYGRR